MLDEEALQPGRAERWEQGHTECVSSDLSMQLRAHSLARRGTKELLIAAVEVWLRVEHDEAALADDCTAVDAPETVMVVDHTVRVHAIRRRRLAAPVAPRCSALARRRCDRPTLVQEGLARDERLVAHGTAQAALVPRAAEGTQAAVDDASTSGAVLGGPRQRVLAAKDAVLVHEIPLAE
jgi:hypothetical protein